MIRLKPLVAFLVSLGIACLGFANESVLFEAMQAELDRSMEKLKLQDSETPYFISYTVTENGYVRASASLGGGLSKASQTNRGIQVEVRVGTYEFDNSNFFSFRSRALPSISSQALPIEDDLASIRKRIWLATDAAYRNAVRTYTAKQANFLGKSIKDRAPDMSEETPTEHGVDSMPVPQLNQERASLIASSLSGQFIDRPNILDSRATVRLGYTKVAYLNSEGTSFTRVRPAIGVNAWVVAQAPNGTEISDFYKFDQFGNEITDDVVDSIKQELQSHLDQLDLRIEAEDAPAIDRFSGPVLFENQAAAEYINQVIVPRLSTLRLPEFDDPRMAPMLQTMKNPFDELIGKRVGTELLSIFEDSTARSYEKQNLPRAFRFDDDGVTTRRTLLIDKGMLSTLLSGRVPTKDVPQSTGNRYGTMISPVNLIVEPHKGLSSRRLHRKFLQAIRNSDEEFGIVVRRVSNPGNQVPGVGGGMNPLAAFGALGGSVDRSDLAPAVLAYKVDTRGDEKLLGSTNFAGVNFESFKEVAAVSADVSMHHVTTGTPLTSMFAGMAGISSFVSTSTTTIVTPDLLFESIDLKAAPSEDKLPPLVPPPNGKSVIPDH